MSQQDGEVDYAMVAFVEDGEWQLQDIASPAFDSVTALSHALRQVAGPDGAVAMVSVDEDFFVIVRVVGATDEKQFHVPLDPKTLAADKAAGVRVRPEHVHEALRQFAGIADHPLAKKFPLGVSPTELLQGFWG